MGSSWGHHGVTSIVTLFVEGGAAEIRIIDLVGVVASLATWSMEVGALAAVPLNMRNRT
jgi:hypothetical protein